MSEVIPESKSKIVNMFLAQGPSFVLIGIIAYIFYCEKVDLNKKVDSCVDTKVEMLKTVLTDNTKAIHRNSDVIDRNTKVLESIKD